MAATRVITDFSTSISAWDLGSDVVDPGRVPINGGADSGGGLVVVEAADPDVPVGVLQVDERGNEVNALADLVGQDH